VYIAEEFTGADGVAHRYVVKEVIPNQLMYMASTPSTIYERTDDEVEVVGTCNAHVARAMGRPDDAVLQVQQTQLVEKNTLTDCKNVARNAAIWAGNPAPIVNGITTATNGASLVTGLTNKAMAGALCNDALPLTSSMRATWYRKRTTDPTWVFISSAVANGGTYKVLVGYPASFLRQMRVQGTFLGGAHTYFLATAY